MLARLKRPGYWILFLAFITVYSYHLFQKNEALERQKAMERLYHSFGESVLSDFRDRRLLSLQSRFGEKGERNIDLEDIALFIDTLHLDRARKTRWKEMQKVNGQIRLSGKLDVEGNQSYPIDMIVFRQGDKILLRGLKVGGKELKLDGEGFPFENVILQKDGNETGKE